MASVCRMCETTGVSLLCSRCKVLHYCSKECQVRHWPAHKKFCKQESDLPYPKHKVVVIPNEGKLREYDLNGHSPGFLLDCAKFEGGAVVYGDMRLAIFVVEGHPHELLDLNPRAMDLRCSDSPIFGPVLLIDDRVAVSAQLAKKIIEEMRHKRYPDAGPLPENLQCI